MARSSGEGSGRFALQTLTAIECSLSPRYLHHLERPRRATARVLVTGNILAGWRRKEEHDDAEEAAEDLSRRRQQKLSSREGKDGF